MHELSLLETLRIESAMAECARSQNAFRRLNLGSGHTSSPKRSWWYERQSAAGG
jgi:hypothetical protein